MWLLSIQAWRQFQRIRFGLEQRPHERAYRSMRSFIDAGPLWTAHVLVEFVQKRF
jgi:hypothetical protein